MSAQNELASFFHAWRFKSERLLRYAFFLVRRELEELRARTGMDATDASDDDEEGGNEAYSEDFSFDPPSSNEGLPKYPWPKRPHKPPPMPPPHPPAPSMPPSCPPVSPAQPSASRGTGGGLRRDWDAPHRSVVGRSLFMRACLLPHGGWGCCFRLLFPGRSRAGVLKWCLSFRLGDRRRGGRR